jgi:hypothetical protein
MFNVTYIIILKKIGYIKLRIQAIPI